MGTLVKVIIAIVIGSVACTGGFDSITSSNDTYEYDSYDSSISEEIVCEEESTFEEASYEENTTFEEDCNDEKECDDEDTWYEVDELEEEVYYSIVSMLNYSYLTESEMLEIMEEGEEYTDFYTGMPLYIFFNEGYLNMGIEDEEVTYLGWYCYTDEIEETEALYDEIIEALEYSFEATGGYENVVDDDHKAYICEIPGGIEINVERTVDDGEAMIYFRVIE